MYTICCSAYVQSMTHRKPTMSMTTEASAYRHKGMYRPCGPVPFRSPCALGTVRSQHQGQQRHSQQRQQHLVQTSSLGDSTVLCWLCAVCGILCCRADCLHLAALGGVLNSLQRTSGTIPAGDMTGQQSARRIIHL